ncbi:MAG: electron transfer flavoprotein subunit alpha/FixB family protein [Acidimicrobiia bacterium]|nr:electron transfer flavoprotein subunit alpha/FixB family protein [Acidimicrobiia bacterium]
MNRDIHVIVEHLRGQVADITYVALAAARRLVGGTEGSVVAVLLGSDDERLAGDLGADRVMYVDDPALVDFNPELYAATLAEVLGADPPRCVLLGDTSMGAETAGTLSARLDLPLVSRCRSVEVTDGALRFVSQICGGKILVQGAMPEPTSLLTMVPGGYQPEEGRGMVAPEVIRAPVSRRVADRVTFKGYREPTVGDVDITGMPVLVAVGRGIAAQDNLELAEELAEALGGAVCASRPVVDQGWLPTTRMVGKSGRRVKPDAYLALGISGAPEHVEGMSGSELTIAINTDLGAPIFDVAQYGSDVDLLDLLPVLIEKVREAKGG